MPRNESLAAPFTISNNGYLKVMDVEMGCFLWRVATEEMVVEDRMTKMDMPPGNNLAPGEGYTVRCLGRFYVEPTPRFTHIDIAVVVYYRPWPFTMFRSHKLFRFVGRPGPNFNSTIWDRQPSDELASDFNKTEKTVGPF